MSPSTPGAQLRMRRLGVGDRFQQQALQFTGEALRVVRMKGYVP